MGSFGSISLSSKFGIILGALIFVAVSAGLIKLWVIKRRLRKHMKLEEEAASKPRGEKHIAGRENDPRYLFGVRAIEKGFYGGVAQTSTHNSFISIRVEDTSPRASTKNGVDTNAASLSSVSLPIQQNRAKRSPSAIQLAPSLTPSNSIKAYSPTSPRSIHATSPTATSAPDSFQDYQEQTYHPAGLSVPNKTAQPGRPRSYLPRLDFATSSEDPSETSFYISPSASTRGRRSNRESIYASDASGSASASATQSRRSSPPQNSDKEVLKTRRITGSHLPLPPIPASSGSDRTEPPTSRPSNRESYRDSTSQKTYRKRGSSDAASLAALTGDRIVPSLPKFEEESAPAARGRNPNPSRTQHNRNTSRSTSLSRAHDSLRRTDRKTSRERSASNRRSKQRDQMHYDPSAHRRNRSGSIQGRAVDFSKPRESPFSDMAAISPYKHAPSSSSSSDSTVSSTYSSTNSRAMDKSDLESTNRQEPAVGMQGKSKLRYTRDVFGTGHLVERQGESSSSNQRNRDSEYSGTVPPRPVRLGHQSNKMM